MDKVTHTSGKQEADGGMWMDEATAELVQEDPLCREELGTQTRPSRGPPQRAHLPFYYRTRTGHYWAGRQGHCMESGSVSSLSWFWNQPAL